MYVCDASSNRHVRKSWGFFRKYPKGNELWAHFLFANKSPGWKEVWQENGNGNGRIRPVPTTKRSTQDYLLWHMCAHTHTHKISTSVCIIYRFEYANVCPFNWKVAYSHENTITKVSQHGRVVRRLWFEYRVGVYETMVGFRRSWKECRQGVAENRDFSRRPLQLADVSLGPLWRAAQSGTPLSFATFAWKQNRLYYTPNANCLLVSIAGCHCQPIMASDTITPDFYIPNCFIFHNYNIILY